MHHPTRQHTRQDNLESMERKANQHEDNLKFLEGQIKQLDESIPDLQVSLGGHDSANLTQTADASCSRTEEETVAQILQQQNSAAAFFCWLKANRLSRAWELPMIKDILGVVAGLAKVDDDNLSRLLSEYLGLETMLALVCKTFEGVKALEKYDNEGLVNSRGGLHCLGSSMGRRINGRFRVICLEDLRPYAGGFVADDLQKRLDLPKPKLQNGECPCGFIDYAVNMINLDRRNLSCLTASGHGLRETLFYGLFSRLQIYRSRSEMLLALPCISDGALSLDGGMMKKSGVFALGSRKDVAVKFPVASGVSDAPVNHIQTEDMIRMLEWEKSKILEDMQREKQLLHATGVTK